MVAAWKMYWQKERPKTHQLGVIDLDKELEGIAQGRGYSTLKF